MYRMMDRTSWFLQIALGRAISIHIVCIFTELSDRDTLEQIDVSKLLIEKYSNVKRGSDSMYR